ncbi:MAG: Holliday junction resolvase RuvX [Thermomicrobiales bacterium]
MRALGLDIGSRRIGTALSDHLGLLAAPWRTIMVGKGRELAEVAAMVAEREIEILVIGLPLSLDGSEGPQAQTVRAFVERLAAHLATARGKDAPPIPIEFADERFTTAEAERLLLERNLSREERRARVDAAAAAIMLQDWLDARRPRQAPWHQRTDE